MRKTVLIFLLFMLSFGTLNAYAETNDVSVSVYVNDSAPLSWITAYPTDKTIYLPAVATAKLLEIDVNIIEYYSSPATVLTKGENCGYFFNDSYYAIINTIGTDMDSPSKIINGILYLPKDVFTSLFGASCTVIEEEGSLRIDLYTKEYNPNAKKYENTVANLTSDTDYLIWVSKKDFSVRLFTNDNNTWHFEKEFPCAIGKDDTPTCEGVYKYYEKITAWKYNNYYVGPVMRFNRGFALHSTLVRYDGTPYDDRVGVKISAGCIRMHPDDIQYLWDTVPLQSTVYVSAD